MPTRDQAGSAGARGRVTGVGHRHYRGGRPRRFHAAAEAGRAGADAAAARHRPAGRRARGGGGPGVGDRHGRHDRRVRGSRRGHPPGRDPRRGALAAHPRGEHQRRLRDVRGGAARRDAAGDLRLVQPRGRVHAALGVPGARLRLSRARYLLRGLQGRCGGPGRHVPLPVRPGRDLPADHVLLPAPDERADAVDVAVTGRRGTAVRGVPDRGAAGVPRSLRGLGQHPRRLGLAGRGEGARLRAAGRRGGVRRRGPRRGGTCPGPRHGPGAAVPGR